MYVNEIAMNNSISTTPLTLNSQVDNPPEHQEQLTQFREAENVTELSLPMSPATDYVKIANTYPNQTPTQILTRNYKVAEFTWSSAGLGLTNLEFPRALITSAPVLGTRLLNFRYLRSGIKLEIRLNSTPYHFGALMVSWMPAHVNTLHCEDAVRRSGNHPVMISASTQEAVTISIPWIHPRLYADTDTDVWQAMLCRVYFDALIPLITTSDNVTDTVKVQVFAAFENPEVAGYVAQSGYTFKREAEKKSKSGIITGSSSPLRAILDSIPIVKDVAPLFETLAILDKPTSVEANQYVSYNFCRNMSMGEGLDTTNPLSCLPNAVLSYDPALMGDDSDTTLISNIVAVPMLRVYQMVTNETSVVEFMIHPWDQDCQGSPDYLRFMSGFFSRWRGSIKYCFQFFTTVFTSARFRISVLYNTPSSLAQQIGDVPSIIVDVKGDTMCDFTVPYLSPTMYQDLARPDYIPKLRIELVSPMVGQSPSQPAIGLVIWRSGGADTQFSQLVDFHGPDATKPAPKQKRSAPKQKAQCDMRYHFKKPFIPIVEGCTYTREAGVATPEAITSIRQMTRRYVEGNPTSDDTTKMKTFPVPSPAMTGAYFRLARIFKYWRGSRRAKFVGGSTIPPFFAISPQVTPSQPRYMSTSAGNGLAYTITEQWNTLDVEIPWYCENPFFPIDIVFPGIDAYDAPNDIVNNLASAGSTIAQAYYCGGDDFTYGFLCGPSD